MLWAYNAGFKRGFTGVVAGERSESVVGTARSLEYNGRVKQTRFYDRDKLSSDCERRGTD